MRACVTGNIDSTKPEEEMDPIFVRFVPARCGMEVPCPRAS